MIDYNNCCMPTYVPALHLIGLVFGPAAKLAAEDTHTEEEED
jgi:hypothetical protein